MTSHSSEICDNAISENISAVCEGSNVNPKLVSESIRKTSSASFEHLVIDNSPIKDIQVITVGHEKVNIESDLISNDQNSSNSMKITKHTHPEWLSNFKSNFHAEVVMKCSELTRTAVDNNIVIEVCIRHVNKF